MDTVINRIQKLTPEVRLNPFDSSPSTDADLIRIGEKIEWLAKDALTKGRIGLSYFHLEFGVSTRACRSPAAYWALPKD